MWSEDTRDREYEGQKTQRQRTQGIENTMGRGLVGQIEKGTGLEV